MLNRPGDRASTWATETLVRMDGAIIGPAGDYVSVVVDYVVYEIPLQNGVVGPKDFWVPLLQVPVTCQVTFGEDGLISAIYDHFDVRGIFMQIRQVTQRVHIRHPLRGGIIPAGGIPEGPRGSAPFTSPPPTQPVMLPRYAASSTSLGQMRSNPGTLGLSTSGQVRSRLRWQQGEFHFSKYSLSYYMISQVGVNTPDARDNVVLGGDRLTSGSLNSGSSICADAPLDSLHNKSPSIGGLTPAPGPPTVGHFSVSSFFLPSQDLTVTFFFLGHGATLRSWSMHRSKFLCRHPMRA